MGAGTCFPIALSDELGAGKLLPRDAERTGVEMSSMPVDANRAPSSKLKAPSYEEAGTCVSHFLNFSNSQPSSSSFAIWVLSKMRKAKDVMIATTVARPMPLSCTGPRTMVAPERPEIMVTAVRMRFLDFV